MKNNEESIGPIVKKTFVILGVIGLALTAIFFSFRYANTIANNGTNDIKPVPTNSDMTPQPTSSASIDDQDDYKGWKTYTNDQLSFEFKYPLEWGSPTTTTKQGGIAGAQLQGSFDKVSVFFGGNTSDYRIDPNIQASGVTFYDFYRFEKATDAFRIVFAENKYHSVISAETITIGTGVEGIFVTNQQVDQIFDENDTMAYTNISDGGNVRLGFGLRYRDIPSAEIENFRLVVKSISPKKGE